MGFNNEDNEGLNLQIPYWFYSINKDKLKPILDTLENFLSNEALSRMHPDNARNIEELQEIESKKQIIQDRRESEKRAKERIEKYNSDLLAGNIYEIEWDKKTDVADVERGICLITKDGTEYSFIDDTLVTKKYNLVSGTLAKYEELKKDLDIIKTCQASRWFLISGLMTRHGNDSEKSVIPEENVRLENLSCDVWNSRITFSIKCVRVYEKHKNGKTYYSNSYLLFNEEKKCLGFQKGREFISLDGFVESNGKLIKQK